MSIITTTVAEKILSLLAQVWGFLSCSCSQRRPQWCKLVFWHASVTSYVHAFLLMKMKVKFFIICKLQWLLLTLLYQNWKNVVIMLQSLFWKVKLQNFISYCVADHDCCFETRFKTNLHTCFHYCNSIFHSSWKVTKLLHETEEKVVLAQLEKWK